MISSPHLCPVTSHPSGLEIGGISRGSLKRGAGESGGLEQRVGLPQIKGWQHLSNKFVQPPNKGGALGVLQPALPWWVEKVQREQQSAL